jgi:hypothetical protein
MTKEEFELIEKLVKLTEADMAEKDAVTKVIRTYLDPGFSMCMTCDAQVQAAFKRLKIWWTKSRDNFSEDIFIKKQKTKTKKHGNG